ncbi:WXG100 family type VII secretion target [Frondihabitans australicus]|uniref:ESAT-6-like protein n=2 Tax=Frondihabitans australicus TaxID=386892 RepID=A0A495IFG7_9MICO|nr:WXG100 family type VII secretion target [Frondihabitans australicus]
MVEEFTQRHSLCDQTVSALVSGPWTGQASVTFHEGWAEWSEGAAKVSEALHGIATLLAEASAQYAETEGRVTRVSQSSRVVSATPVAGAGGAGVPSRGGASTAAGGAA